MIGINMKRPGWKPVTVSNMMQNCKEKERLLERAHSDSNDLLVSINHSAIKSLILPGNIESLPSWDWILTRQLKFNNDPAPALMFWLLSVSFAFRFWTLAKGGHIRKYCYARDSGSNAAFKTMMFVWGDEITPWQLRNTDWSVDILKNYFGDIPAPSGRVQILSEIIAGDILERCVDYFISRAEKGRITVDDAQWLSEQLPLSYGGDPYLKKAQLYCSAVAGFLSSRGTPVRVDLTAMADYQVPRVLRSLNIIQYNDELAFRIDHHKLILQGSIEERAIRAATILACELIGKEHGLNSASVDHYLWNSQEIAGNSRFHLTETTNY